MGFTPQNAHPIYYFLPFIGITKNNLKLSKPGFIYFCIYLLFWFLYIEYFLLHFLLVLMFYVSHC